MGSGQLTRRPPMEARVERADDEVAGSHSVSRAGWTAAELAAGHLSRAGKRPRAAGEPEGTATGSGGESSGDEGGSEGALGAAVLVLFAGTCEAESHLVGELRRAGARVTAVDIKLGGRAHNLLRPAVQKLVRREVRAGHYDMVFVATPCESFSVANAGALRSKADPRGEGAPPEFERYVRKHNAFARFTADVVLDAHRAGAQWAIENPADRGTRGAVAFWEEFEGAGCLWDMPEIAQATRAAQGRSQTFAQCAFGARYQKWTTLAYSEGLVGALRGLRRRGCAHEGQRHAEHAYGVGSDGQGKALAAAAYPAGLCRYLARAVAEACGGRRETAPTVDASDGKVVEGLLIEGGRIRHGAALTGSLRAACNRERERPPKFASLRNRVDTSAAERRAEPMPPGLDIPARSSRAARRGRPRADLKRRAQPVGACESRDAAADPADGRAERPGGKISIEQLFMPGVYSRVERWLAKADAAAFAIAERKRGRDVPIPRVPTEVIEQTEMAEWARGVVWDTSDAADCVAVVRSDRHTVFPGKRQLDRAALRAAAAELGWADTDIVSQAGEGGMEPRSECELLTVLAFHHPGLLDEVAAAEEVVAKHLEEEWVSPGLRHLPFVPCRMQPRDVIMQERSRVVGGGVDGAPQSVEHYLKPRVTTNSSYGGADSVNAGVPGEGRAVELPTVQWLARALGICDTAGGEAAGKTVHAAPYCVDAESAYSFCPINTGDLWTQCYVWWDEAGRAQMHVDRRMGFGGAFAPNRFERLSTLVAAWGQRAQMAFDEAHPPPECARAWAEERREAQRAGRLADVHLQVRPAYLQVYIDDFTGVALDDEVPEPAEVAGVVLDRRSTEAGGGVFAERGTRVHVHAQLMVRALSELGLHAAPQKVVVGDPIIALGFTVGRRANMLSCPEQKRGSIISDIDTQAEAAREALLARRRTAERLVGRLVNLSQIYPEMKPLLHGGYGLFRSVHQRTRSGPGELGETAKLKAGGRRQREWLELLAFARAVLEVNAGVPLAPRRHFAAIRSAGSIISVTDASGDDGVGGYVFVTEASRTVWLVSEAWPEFALAARRRDVMPHSERAGTTAAPTLSMPAAELFGQWAVAAAVAAAGGWLEPTAVFGFCDCDPAVHTLNAASSGNAQMRALVVAARAMCEQWLAISVPREANRDADRLSHPEMLAEVEADAVAAGFVVRVAPVPAECWVALQAATELATR